MLHVHDSTICYRFAIETKLVISFLCDDAKSSEVVKLADLRKT